MPSNPYQSKRVQVVFSQTTRDAVEAFGEDRGLTNSKAVAYLVEEALRARGLLENKTDAPDPKPDVSDFLSPNQSVMERIVSENNLPGSVTTSQVNRQTSASTQEMKLRLMQDLMDQLKSL
jgi:hypothetical protein